MWTSVKQFGSRQRTKSILHAAAFMVLAVLAASGVSGADWATRPISPPGDVTFFQLATHPRTGAPQIAYVQADTVFVAGPAMPFDWPNESTGLVGTPTGAAIDSLGNLRLVIADAFDNIFVASNVVPQVPWDTSLVANALSPSIAVDPIQQNDLVSYWEKINFGQQGRLTLAVHDAMGWSTSHIYDPIVVPRPPTALLVANDGTLWSVYTYRATASSDQVLAVAEYDTTSNTFGSQVLVQSTNLTSIAARVGLASQSALITVVDPVVAVPELTLFQRIAGQWSASVVDSSGPSAAILNSDVCEAPDGHQYVAYVHVGVNPATGSIETSVRLASRVEPVGADTTWSFETVFSDRTLPASAIRPSVYVDDLGEPVVVTRALDARDFTNRIFESRRSSGLAGVAESVKVATRLRIWPSVLRQGQGAMALVPNGKSPAFHLIDIQGRASAVSAVPESRETWRLQLTGSPGPGVYWLRVQDGGVAEARRVVVLR